jgi:cytidyltransferase-like protein
MHQHESGALDVARDVAELARQIDAVPSAGKVVLCHGCFDPLHYGHLLHFREAKKFGNMLVVTITCDMFVNKGNGRPIFAAEQRADMVAALRVVDRVGISEFETAARILEVVRPAVFVKGIDYVDSNSPLLRAELSVAERLGIEVRYTSSGKMSASDLCRQAGWLDRVD